MNDKILTIKKSTLVDIANEVRAKTGSTDLIKVADLDDAVANLQGGGADYPAAEYSVNIYNSFVNSIYYSLDLGKTWLTLDAESEVDATTIYGITSGIGAAAFDQPIPTISAGIVLIGLAGSKDDDNFITMTSELQITVESDFGSAYYNRGTGVYSISNISDQSISEAEFVYAIPVLSDAGITVGCRPS